MDTYDVKIPDLRAVEQLTSLTDISRLLHETLATERGLEAELEQLLSTRGVLEQRLLALHTESREVRVNQSATCSSCWLGQLPQASAISGCRFWKWLK